MPVRAYFGGHGAAVMRDMRKRYGSRAEDVFYRTAKAKNQEPSDLVGMLAEHRRRGSFKRKGARHTS